GVRVTLINFIFMALFTALLFLTLPGSGAGSFSAFYLVLWACFVQRVSAAVLPSR
ncbi:nitrite extrusion protein 2, partial [Salmonella enterica subsp. enterica serovar Heidelberg str. N4496]